MYTLGQGYVPVSGAASSGVVLVGEAPGETEARIGKPFVGEAGFYLDRLLRRAGLDRKTFALHNVLSCRPPNNWLVGAPWETKAIEHCAPYLDRTFRDQRPKAVVAMGNTALRRLVPGADGITRHRGFVLQDKLGRPVIPTYHPSYLLPRKGQENTSRFVGVVIRDLRKAVRIASEGFTRLKTNYSLDDDPTVLMLWIQEFERAYACTPGLFLSFDIETPYKIKHGDDDDLTESAEEDETPEPNGPPLAEPILRISFAYKPGHAISIPWQAQWLDGIKQLLAHPCRKTVWNGVRFDVPVIESHGVAVNGRIYDFMWGFHMWQSDLPKNLEFASSLLTDLTPWKHLSDSQPAHYNAVDADAQLRCGLELERELQESKQWDIFERHMVDLDPLLMAMGRQGVHIDRVAQDALRTELQGERDRLNAEAQLCVPDELFPRSEYKRLPADPTGRRFRERRIVAPTKVCSHCALAVSNKTEHLRGGKKTNPCAAANATLILEPRTISVWDEIEPFNPNSVQALIAYANHFSHPVPLNHKTKKPSLGKKAVAHLAKVKGAKHPIYQIALTIRSVRKTLGTYVEGFAPDGSGRIYTTYGYHPSSGRLSSRSVNLQNVSHRGDVAYADRVRRTLIPRPGHVFVEADSSAIEAVFTGFFMGSDEYIALAKRGIHDYLTCLELGIAFDDAGIKLSKGLHKATRDRNKVVVHGTSYGMTPYLMHMTYEKIFPHVRDAEIAQQRFFDACPGLKDWQHAVRTFAHKQTYLENPWHYRHYFYDVFKKDAQGNVVLGEDAKRCVSFLPQSSAAAFMKDNLVLLSKTQWWPMPANGLVHDSYTLEVLPEDVPHAVATLRSILERPIPEVNDLTVGCEVKVGRENWNELVAA